MSPGHSLLELGFGAGLLNHLLAYDPDSLLAFRCRPPEYWQSSTMASRNITPLWECGVTLAYFNRDTRSFEKCSLEDTSDVWIRYQSAQALLANLMIELYEDELTLEQLRSAAALIGFTHVDRFLDELGSLGRKEYDAWTSAFPHTCEA